MNKNFPLSDLFSNDGKPYCIIKNGFSNYQDFFEEIIIKTAEKQGFRGIKTLSSIHEIVLVKDINRLRLAIFNEINKVEDWSSLIYKSIIPRINYMLGHDLSIQSKLNLSIQMPNDETSILEEHLDFRSGDSPFQLVIWIALTNSYLDNSMFIKYNNLTEFIEVKKGDILIFDPNIPHGNKINTTEHTRISMNVRIKNWFSPDMEDLVPDRQFGIYYKDLSFSSTTLNSFKLIKEID